MKLLIIMMLLLSGCAGHKKAEIESPPLVIETTTTSQAVPAATETFKVVKLVKKCVISRPPEIFDFEASTCKVKNDLLTDYLTLMIRDLTACNVGIDAYNRELEK